MIVGMHGLKGVGKDTAADYLVSVGFVKMGFADGVYEELAINFNLDVADLKNRFWKTTPNPCFALAHCRDDEFVRRMIVAEMQHSEHEVKPLCTDALHAPRTSTWLCQNWATAYRRHDLGRDYWAQDVAASIHTLPRGTHVVLSDLREDHEMIAFDAYREQNCRNVGGLQSIAFGGVLELTRRGTQNTGHVSDSGLSRHHIDAVYANDGSTYDLYRALDDFITKGIKCL